MSGFVINFFFIWTIICVLSNISAFVINKNDDLKAKHTNEYSEHGLKDINYDDYPVVVPKRAAMLLDRIMVALHHALEDDERGSRSINEMSKDGRYFGGRKFNSEELALPSKLNLKSEGSSDEDSLEFETRGVFDKFKIQEKEQTEDTMDLQRRGHGIALSGTKGRMYWRCYFNAVTCF